MRRIGKRLDRRPFGNIFVHWIRALDIGKFRAHTLTRAKTGIQVSFFLLIVAVCPLGATEAGWRLASAVAPVAGSFDSWGPVRLEGSGAGPLLAPVVLRPEEGAASGRWADRPAEVPDFKVSLDLSPETVHLQGYDRPVSASLEVSGSESAADISTGAVRVSKIGGKAVSPPVFIDPKSPATLADTDHDGLPELKVQFPRKALIALLPGDAEVRIAISGVFRDGIAFEAEDALKTSGKALRAVEEAEEGFSLLAAYAFPVPAKGVNPTIRLQTRGTADSAQITILNRFQEPVFRGTAGPPQRIDGRWTHDFIWNASGARTGIYIFRITARRAGYPDISAVGKLAVIR